MSQFTAHVHLLVSVIIFYKYYKNFKELPKYILISSSGPIHNPTFKISVQITNSKKFLGAGNSKREAQQNAAEKLLKTLNKL